MEGVVAILNVFDSVGGVPLTERQKQIMQEYYDNDGEKLRREVDRILIKYQWLPQSEYDEFYSMANLVFTQIITKYIDENKDFNGLLYSCLNNRIISLIDARNAKKRMNTVNTVDENGNEQVVYLNNVSLDAPVGSEEDHVYLKDILKSDENVEDNIAEFREGNDDERVKKFLSELPNIQRKILELRMNEVPVEEIMKKLHISRAQYNVSMVKIKQNNNIDILNNHKGGKNHRYNTNAKINKEGKTMVIDFMDLKNMEIVGDTEGVTSAEELQGKILPIKNATDSYKEFVMSMEHLLDEKADGILDCNYVAQRVPGQWSTEHCNRYISRVLNNQPVSEIIECEVNEYGKDVVYLIDGLQRLTYAERFRNNKIRITKKGAECPYIPYEDYLLDEKGNKMIDENGRAKSVTKIFCIYGKKFNDLPEYLQKRFDKFVFKITKHFNCTDDLMNYHMRNYNNGKQMNRAQYGVTYINTDTIKNIKSISQKHPFCKNYVKANDKNGSMEDFICRCIMTMYHMDNWKKDTGEVYQYIENYANKEEFEHLNDVLTMFYNAIENCTDDIKNNIKKVITVPKGAIWIDTFDKYMSEIENAESEKFIKFMIDVEENMQDKLVDITSDNDFDEKIKTSLEEIGTKQTKSKEFVLNRKKVIIALMKEYFGLANDSSYTSGEMDMEIRDVREFLSEVRNMDYSEDDISLFEEMFNDYTVEVDNKSRLLDERNRASWIALIAYAFDIDKDIELGDWMVEYFKNNKMYTMNQSRNYRIMKNDFDKYLENHNKEKNGKEMNNNVA